MFLRQLPVKGIDTKWLATHAIFVLALLDEETAGQAAEELSLSKPRKLHHRLGLRVVPELVQVTVLDPALSAQFADMCHFAATVDDLNRWPRQSNTVLILENKQTAFAIVDDFIHAVVLHGRGFHVDQYARISWARNAKRVIYWGDIDAPGL